MVSVEPGQSPGPQDRSCRNVPRFACGTLLIRTRCIPSISLGNQSQYKQKKLKVTAFRKARSSVAVIVRRIPAHCFGIPLCRSLKKPGDDPLACGSLARNVPRAVALRYVAVTVVADNKKNSKLQHLEKQEAQLL